MTLSNWKSVSWESPSNIAAVKYWGKLGDQLPMNPSVSMTLSQSRTILHFMYREARGTSSSFEFFFEDKPRPDFGERIRLFLARMEEDLPFLKKLDIRIETRNTFPHSAGIASSASSMSALALALATLEKEREGAMPEGEMFLRRASHLSRLASGSACRSVFPGWALWGESALVPGSSNEHAIPVNHMLHKTFGKLYDAVLIVSPGKKQVSSSAGHAVMKDHPFRETRINQAGENTGRLLKALGSANMPLFIEVLENEALSLHGLMLSSQPGFFLFHPNTLRIIEKIRRKREQTGWEMCFTLDAGPNVHLLYPESLREQVSGFIAVELLPLCAEGQWIDDFTGKGPARL